MQFVKRESAFQAASIIAFVAMLACSGCSASGTVAIGGLGGSGSVTISGAGGIATGAGGAIIVTLTSSDAGSGAGGTSGTTATTEVWPPPGYLNVTNASYGAYALGPEIDSPSAPASGSGGTSGAGGSTAAASGICGGLYGVVRDFKMSSMPGGHPDFEHDPQGGETGIVQKALGSDGKPVYGDHPTGTLTTTGKTYFDQWYRDVPGVNRTYLVGLHFVQNGNVVTFAASMNNKGVSDSSYFPLDNAGFGNQGYDHNFSFTTEIHTNFTYNGGEVFTFQGDDDVFVFINGQLAIDMGGIHPQDTKTVDLDAQASTLGISKGQIYPLAVFNAERHTSQSNFRVDTTMAFTDCGQVNGQPVIY